MTIARSFSKPPRDPDDRRSWPVLARIPDLSADARPTQRPARPASPARPNDRRFDVARPRAEAESSIVEAIADRDLVPRRKLPIAESQYDIAVEDDTQSSSSDRIPAIGKHTAHLPQPPAHHLNQRGTRYRTIDEPVETESPILPNWNPFANTGRRLPETFAPILSFVVMVALFTAAGTCILLMRSTHRHGMSESPAAATPADHAAAAPTAPSTAAGPLGTTASRLIPAEPGDSTDISLPDSRPTQFTASASKNATGNSATGAAQSPPANSTDQDYPATQYPEPEFPEANDVQLPQANATGAALPVARFSGQILESPTRQAKNVDQSILH